jgi:hypothetical protein
MWHSNRCVIAHNNLTYARSKKHLIKMHNSSIAGGTPTQFVIIRDNYLEGNDWLIAIGPQNATVDERVLQFVVERNRIVATGSSGATALNVWARIGTIRNNAIIYTAEGDAASSSIYGISIAQRGIEPIPSRIIVFNNTFYTEATGTQPWHNYTAIGISKGEAIHTRNNLGSAASWATGTVSIVPGDDASSGNLLANDPGFRDPSIYDFRLEASILGAMTRPHVRDDYLRRLRPHTAPTIGGYEPQGQ